MSFDGKCLLKYTHFTPAVKKGLERWTLRIPCLDWRLRMRICVFVWITNLVRSLRSRELHMRTKGWITTSLRDGSPCGSSVRETRSHSPWTFFRCFKIYPPLRMKSFAILCTCAYGTWVTIRLFQSLSCSVTSFAWLRNEAASQSTILSLKNGWSGVVASWWVSICEVIEERVSIPLPIEQDDNRFC